MSMVIFIYLPIIYLWHMSYAFNINIYLYIHICPMIHVSDHELLIAKLRLKLKKVGKATRRFSSFQFSIVTQLCPTLCNPMNCSMTGLPVNHQLPEFTQTHVHWVGDAIKPSHPLPSPSPSAFNLSQQERFSFFSNETGLHIKWSNYWSFSFSISLSNEYSGLISFRMGWLDLLAVQGTLKNLLQHHSSEASILQCSAFFIVQLTSIHDYWRNHRLD